MQIYIIRHGETDLNRRGVLQGRVDAPLNESGRQLAILTGRAITDIHFDACISSPLKRAAETAEIVLRESGHVIVEDDGNASSGDGDRTVRLSFDDRIMEMNCGVWELHKLSEMGEEAVRLFTDDPYHFPRFEGGESFADVRDRTGKFLQELIARDDGRTYLISTHGCALRSMLGPYYDDPTDYWQGHVPYNCCVSILEAAGGKARLVEMDKVYYPKELIVDRYKY